MSAPNDVYRQAKAVQERAERGCGPDGAAALGAIASSAAFGSRIGQAVALACRPLAVAEEGRAVEVCILGRDRPGAVTLRLPYNPDGLRLRAKPRAVAPARTRAMEAAE